MILVLLVLVEISGEDSVLQATHLEIEAESAVLRRESAHPFRLMFLND